MRGSRGVAQPARPPHLKGTKEKIERERKKEGKERKKKRKEKKRKEKEGQEKKKKTAMRRPRKQALTS